MAVQRDEQTPGAGIGLHEDAKEYTIFDADFHLNLHLEDLLDAEETYIQDPVWREKLERWGFPPSPGGKGFNKSYASETDGRSDHRHGRAITPGEVQEVKHELGLDEVLLTLGQFHLPLPRSPYPVLKAEITRAVNDYMLDHVVDVDRGIYGGLLVPSWDVELGLEQLERHGEKDGIISAFNFYPGYRPWGYEGFDPLYDKLVELELPLQLHVDKPPQNHGTLTNDSKRTRVEATLSGKSSRITTEICNIVFTGVFEKYPELDIVINEGATTWISTLGPEMDNWYQQYAEDICLTPRMRELDRQYLSKLPSEYLWENISVTSHPIALPKNPRRAKAMLDLCHAEQTFIFATDWPHSTVDPPNWVFDNPNIDDDLRRQILEGNARDVYRFPS